MAGALERVRRGETLARDGGYSPILGELLCARVEVAVLAERPEETARALREAEALAQALGTSPTSELGVALARARRLGAMA